MQAESVGRVVTLMSNDAQKLQDAAFAIHSIWASPALIVAILILLWFQVGGWVGWFVGRLAGELLRWKEWSATLPATLVSHTASHSGQPHCQPHWSATLPATLVSHTAALPGLLPDGRVSTGEPVNKRLQG
eukprot:199396-Chlamydomonas_euryale.AAC.4